MAAVDVTNQKLKFNESASYPSLVQATDQTDGIRVNYTRKTDGNILLILENGSSSPITANLLAGNGLQGVADMPVEIAGNQSVLLVVESGKFVNVSGENKGFVVINGSTDLKAAAIELP